MAGFLVDDIELSMQVQHLEGFALIKTPCQHAGHLV